MVAPLHNLTRKRAVFPNPWLEGTDYDVSFHRPKSAMLDEALCLWNKDPKKRLCWETGASDLGWGACAYQFAVILVQENLLDKGKHRLQNCINDQKQII